MKYDNIFEYSSKYLQNLQVSVSLATTKQNYIQTNQDVIIFKLYYYSDNEW